MFSGGRQRLHWEKPNSVKKTAITEKFSSYGLCQGNLIANSVL